MKERLVIFIALIVLIVVLVGLNAASFVQREKEPDTELSPNRSTYNTGATGTRAFYDLLAETGRRVVRWQEPPSALANAGKNKPNTFVVIGSLRREFEDAEIRQLLQWVSLGGKLVVIDREPSAELISTTANWSIKAAVEPDLFPVGYDPSDQTQMTAKTSAAKPAQPTVYTINVNAVQPSIFASSANFKRFSDDYSKPQTSAPIVRTPTPKSSNSAPGKNSANEPKIVKTATPVPTQKRKNANSNQASSNSAPVPTIENKPADSADFDEMEAQTAPVVHLSDGRKNLLVDFPLGLGKIVFLTDPYIVANGGISLVDNAQLAVNVVGATDGIIAFDEYHQGYGANSNQLFAYFAGTPVMPIILQLAALIGLIFYSQSRRFARALPADEPNRLSKLEYVAAMAELQQRTRGYDLAIENIYADFRRRASRLFGVDNFTTARTDLARLIAERLPSENFKEIDKLMRDCENVAHGEKTNKKEVVQLAGRLREIEEKLGLQRRKKRRQK